VVHLVEESYGPSCEAKRFALEACAYARVLVEAHGVDTREQGDSEVHGRSEALLSSLDAVRPAGGTTGALSSLEHEQIGNELKLLQRETTRLCLLTDGEDAGVVTALGKLDHLLRKLRSELDRRALRELPRPTLARAVSYYYGEPVRA